MRLSVDGCDQNLEGLRFAVGILGENEARCTGGFQFELIMFKLLAYPGQVDASLLARLEFPMCCCQVCAERWPRIVRENGVGRNGTFSYRVDSVLDIGMAIGSAGARAA